MALYHLSNSMMIVRIAALLMVLAGAAGCQRSQPSVPVARVGSVAPRHADPAGFWPRWGGPRGNLVSDESGWQAAWPESGPVLAWRAEVGTGFSSVAVAEGRLFTMGHRGGQDVVYALDAATGQELWTHRYECDLADNLHEGGPGATPTVAGDRVYTLSREGHLFCLDAATGKVRWFRQMADELSLEPPEWGFTCSPLVLDDKVIVDVGRTVALDAATGKTIWQTKKYLPGYGSPAAFVHEDQQLLAVLNNDGLLIVQAADGKERALFRWETHYATNATTPLVDGDAIFISTGYGKGCALLRFDGSSLSPVYQNRHIRCHFSNCVLWEGFVYGFDGQSNNSAGCRLVCMNQTNGEVAWTKRGFGYGSLMVADGKLIVMSDKGVLAVVEATAEEFRLVSQAQVLRGRCWTVPVLAGQRIYCRNAVGDLVCVDVAPPEA